MEDKGGNTGVGKVGKKTATREWANGTQRIWTRATVEKTQGGGGRGGGENQTRGTIYVTVYGSINTRRRKEGAGDVVKR